MRSYDSARPLPPYVRALALLKDGKGAAAADEFRKARERRGRMRVNVVFPLSRLGLGRALAATGDMTGAAAAYSEFFTLWKDADPDLPVLVQAHREFAALTK